MWIIIIDNSFSRSVDIDMWRCGAAREPILLSSVAYRMNHRQLQVLWLLSGFAPVMPVKEFISL